MLAYIRSVAARRDGDEGASAVEYGLLVAAVAALIVVIIFLLGGIIRNTFGKTCDAINTQGTSTTKTGC